MIKMTTARATRLIQPVSLKQKYVLDQNAHPDCTEDLRERWILKYAVRVRPGIDLRRLARAVEKLRSRHDTLRIRFGQVKGQWRALIEPPGPVEIPQSDLSHLDDAAFHSAIRDIAAAPMPLVGGPLTDLTLVRGGAHGDVVVFRVHHSLSDGYGMVTLTEEFMQFLIGIPIQKPAVSHADYITQFQSPSRDRAAEIAAFWAEMHRDFPPAPNAGRKAKGLEPLWTLVGEREPKCLTVKTGPQCGARFEAWCAQIGANPATALITAFAEALCQCYDIDDLAFTVPVARTEPALDTFIGDHTLTPFVRYRPAGDAGIEQGILRLSATLLDVLAHLPSDAARRGTAHEPALIAGGAFPGQFSISQPRAVSRQNRSVLRESFRAGPGDERQVGPFLVSTMDVTTPHRALADVQFELHPTGETTDFSLFYDGIGYTGAEMRALADRICALMRIEPVEISER